MTPIAHDYRLVLLSVILAIQASYVGLRLTKQATDIDGTVRRHVLAGAALSLATGIWGMHFVGMLALKLPFPVDYAVLPTLLSFLACVLVVGLALAWTSLSHLTWATLAGASTVMGLGIVTMHYLGMAALHAAAHLDHDPLIVALAVLISVVASALALWLAFGESSRTPAFASAVVLGVAISGMHYTAMAGVSLHPLQTPLPKGDPEVSSGLLALVVSFVAFLVSGLFILTLIPDRRGRVAIVPPAPAGPAQAVAEYAPPETAPAPAAAPAGGPAPQEPAQEGPAQAEPVRESPRIPRDGMPVMRDGSIRSIPLDRIAAIHANAHYTYVTTDSQSLFSPLSISEADERLPPDRFMRIHRSHIVNLGRIVRLTKTVDSAMVEIDCAQRPRLPVARARLPELKKRMAQRAPELHELRQPS